MRQWANVSGLHISKVAVGCASFEALQQRQQARLAEGIVPVRTRFRPKRADELVGGSLFWIVSHRFAARNLILGFDRDDESGRTIIRLDSELVRVCERPKRAHQGWRYLVAADAPADLTALLGGPGDLPPALLSELSALALV